MVRISATTAGFCKQVLRRFQQTAFFLFLLLCVILSNVACATSSPFYAWRDDLAKDAQTQGVSLETLQKIMPTLQYDQEVIRLDQKQPEHTMTFARYYRNTITSGRIEEGRRLAKEHDKTLRDVERKYGVPRSVIVALWAIESSYGRNMGDFDVINSLATLAYDGRRAEFFRKELITALKVVDDDPDLWPLTGSWAGAMGQCQFMPSTFAAYAQDGNKDGHRDIWNSEDDVLTSIAHYLSREGWKAEQNWGTEVVVSKQIPKSWEGVDYKESLTTWHKRGIYPMRGEKFPVEAQHVSLIQFQGTDGRSFLVYDNFRALMRWNRSTYFATAVGLLADAIEKGL